MMYRRLLACWLLVLLLLPLGARAADVQATLDRSSVSLGETVTLELHIQGDAGNVAMPDFSALAAEFDLLGTSQESSLNVVNGAATSTLTLSVVLRPKHVGALSIPSLDVAGSHTVPLQLDVTAGAAVPGAAAHREVFMEAQLEPGHGYVGQPLSYVVKLFFSASISDGTLEPPQVNGLQISQQGTDTSYAVERDGRQYRVLERRYALTPQHAGRLDIPASTFQGVAIDPDDPDSFFGARKPVSANAPALSIDVKPVPADWGSSAWLPARQLSLTMDGVPDAPSAQNAVRVGQPVNLTMNLQATGLPAETLPALSLPSLDGVVVYPDKPVTSSRVDGGWMVGQRQQAFAIVPQRAGTLTIPATSLKWWNVVTDRMEVAQIPAHTLTVLPAAGSLDVQTANPASSSSSAMAPSGKPEAAFSAKPAAPWRWIAIGSLGLWLLSLLVWLLWRRRPPPPQLRAAEALAYPSTREARLAFLAAAQGNDTSLQMRQLLAWARMERPAIQHLGELAAQLVDAAQREAIGRLQQRHYAGASSVSGNDAALAEVFKRGFAWRVDDAGDQGSDLPPLYPFKLH